MTTNTKLTKLTDEYSAIYAQEAELGKQREDLASQIKELMESEGETNIDKPAGLFTMYPVKSWKFSAKVTKAKTILEQMQKEEKTTGKASYEITGKAMRFTPKAK